MSNDVEGIGVLGLITGTLTRYARKLKNQNRFGEAAFCEELSEELTKTVKARLRVEEFTPCRREAGCTLSTEHAGRCRPSEL